MISIGITGQSGFVGTHIYNKLKDCPEQFKIIPFEDSYFSDEKKLQNFVCQCDVIIHLAAMMRSTIEGEVYRVNMELANKLIAAVNSTNSTPCILFSSSIQEGNGSEYAICKQEVRNMLADWANSNKTGFLGMMFPNLFGPGAKPYSHSFIATFCHQLSHDKEPKILVDNTVPLKYIDTIVDEILKYVKLIINSRTISTIEIQPEYRLKVTEVLEILRKIKSGKLPSDKMEKAFYETYISYIDYGK